MLKKADVVGALGWTAPDVELGTVAKLLREAGPDLPPNRVAIYVCPECGDLGCGAVTVAIDRDGEDIIWSDFRWERNWIDPFDLEERRFDVGPFRFETDAYTLVLNKAGHKRPHPM